MIIKIRQGIFETNSSSSHSFSLGPVGRFNSTLEIINGKITIYMDSWDSHYKTNDPSDKLAYLFSFIYTKFGDPYDDGDDDDKALYKEYKNFVTDVVLKFTGARKLEVIGTQEVDHQSMDIFDERDVKDPEFIKEFVFNEDTWLYPLWDSSSPEPGFYEDDRETKLVHLKFEGVVEDLELTYLDIHDYDVSWKISEHLSNYLYDPDKDVFINRSGITSVKVENNGLYYYQGNYIFSPTNDKSRKKIIKVTVCPIV